MSHNYSFTDLVDVSEIQTAFPRSSISFRLLLPDHTVLMLKQHPTSLDTLLHQADAENDLARLCDTQILNESVRYKGVSLHEYPSGLLGYVAPIHSEGRLLAVLASGWMRPDDLYKPINLLVELCRSTPEEVEQAIALLPSVKVEELKTIFELVYSFLIRLVHTGLERAFLLEAATMTDVDELLNLIVHRVPILVWNTFCSVFLWDQQKDMFILAKTNNPDLKVKEGQDGYHLGEGLTGWVGKYGRPLFVKNIHDPEELARYEDPEAHIPAPVWSGTATGITKMVDGQGNACMMVPIQTDEMSQSAGVIRLLPSQANFRIAPRHFDLLSKLAKLISGTLQHAQLLSSITEMTGAVGHADVEEFLRVVLNQISQWFRSFSTHIRICDRTQEQWYLLATSKSPYTGTIERRQVVSKGHEIEPIVNGNSLYYINNSVQDDRDFQVELERARQSADVEYIKYLEQIGATLIIPMRDRRDKDTIIGLLILHRRIGDQFKLNEIPLVEQLAYVLTRGVTAMAFSHRFKGEQAAHHHLDILDETLFSKGAIAQRATLAVMDALDCDVVIVRELNWVTQRLLLICSRTREGSSFSAQIPASLHLGEGASGQAAKERNPLLFSVEDRESIHHKDYHEAREAADTQRLQLLEQIGSGIAVPLLVADQCVGVLTALSKMPSHYRPHDVDVLQMIGDRTALLLHCAQLIEIRDHPQSQLEGILKATRRMLKAGDEEQIFRIALTAATHKNGLGFCRALILLADESGYNMQLPLARGGTNEVDQDKLWHEPAASDLDAAYEASEEDVEFKTDPLFNAQVKMLTITRDDAPQNPRLISRDGEDWERRVLDCLGSYQAAVAPMQTLGEPPIGLLIVDNRFLTFGIIPEDIPSLQILASQVASTVSTLRQMARAAQAHLQAWIAVSEQASHMVGTRIFTLETLVKQLEIRLSRKSNVEQAAADILPRMKVVLEDAKKLARNIRDVALLRTLKLRYVKLSSLIRTALRESTPMQQGTKLYIEENIPLIRCDPELIKYCVAELIHNAVDAGATHMKIFGYYIETKDEFEIVVCDNGSGIPIDNQDKIFEPYFTTKDSGTGMGLVLLRRIVEAHRGNLWLNTEGTDSRNIYQASGLSSGACFIISLPRKI